MASPPFMRAGVRAANGKRPSFYLQVLRVCFLQRLVSFSLHVASWCAWGNKFGWGFTHISICKYLTHSLHFSWILEKWKLSNGVGKLRSMCFEGGRVKLWRHTSLSSSIEWITSSYISSFLFMISSPVSFWSSKLMWQLTLCFQEFDIRDAILFHFLMWMNIYILFRLIMAPGLKFLSLVMINTIGIKVSHYGMGPP